MPNEWLGVSHDGDIRAIKVSIVEYQDVSYGLAPSEESSLSTIKLWVMCHIRFGMRCIYVVSKSSLKLVYE